MPVANSENTGTSLPSKNQEPIMQKKKLYSSPLFLTALALLTVLVLFVGYKLLNPKSTPSAVTQRQSLQTVKPRSKAPGVIVSAVSATSIDPKTGEAVNPTTVFSQTDKNIYVVTTLKGAKVGTRIEYVRLLNNKFLDNRSIQITKPNVNNTSFVWKLKNAQARHLTGTYRIKLYTNGIFEKEISYTVQ